MLIEEIVLQGVRCFRSPFKVLGKTGYNIVLGQNETGKTTLAECILDMLYAAPAPAEGFVSWGLEKACRAAMVFSSGEGKRFRLIKDFQKDLIQLSRYNNVSGKYEPVTQNADEIRKTLGEECGLPDREIFKSLFFADPYSLPSRFAGRRGSASPSSARPAARPASPAVDPAGGNFDLRSSGTSGSDEYDLSGGDTYTGGDLSAGGEDEMYMGGGNIPGAVVGADGGSGAPPVGGGGDERFFEGSAVDVPLDEQSPEEKREKLEKFRKELETALEVEKKQYELDGIQSQYDDAESKVVKVKELDGQLSEVGKKIGEYAIFEDLPSDIDQRIQNHKKLEAKKNAEIDKTREKIIQLENLVQSAVLTPFFKEIPFIAGVALVPAAIVANFVWPGYSAYFFLPILAGLASLGYSLFNTNKKNESLEAQKKKLQTLREREQEVQKRFEVQTSVTANLIRRFNVDSSTDLMNLQKEFADLKAKQKAIAAEKEKITSLPEWEGIDGLLSETKEKIDALGAEIRAAGGGGMDASELKRQVKRLERDLNITGEGASEGEGEKKSITGSLDALGELGDEGGVPDASGLGAINNLLAGAAKLVGQPREQIVEAIRGRFNMYIKAFSGGRYVETSFQPDGSLTLAQADPKMLRPFEELSPATRDAVYFGLKLTLIEYTDQKIKIPLIIDDALVGIDDRRLSVFTKALKKLGVITQIIHLTSRESLQSVADNLVKLPVR